MPNYFNFLTLFCTRISYYGYSRALVAVGFNDVFFEELSICDVTWVVRRKVV